MYLIPSPHFDFNMDELSQFCRRQAERGISLKSSLIEYELRRRGIKYTRPNTRLLLCEIGGRPATFFLMNGPSSSVAIRTICDNKWVSRKLFAANGLAVARSAAFGRNALEKALKYARSRIRYPLVIKPNSASRGRGVTTGITDDEAFRAAWQRALAESRSPMLLVERQVTGHDFRLFVVGDKIVSATWRKPASVTGNGTSSILQLIESKNMQRARNLYLGSYPIPTDPARLEALALSGHDLNFVPAADEKIPLRKVANLSSGGDSIDVTEQVHPTFHDIAVAAIRSCPGMGYGGVDIIAQDIATEATPDNHIVGEIEFSPAPLAHFPFKGEARDMAGAIIDFYSEL